MIPKFWLHAINVSDNKFYLFFLLYWHNNLLFPFQQLKQNINDIFFYISFQIAGKINFNKFRNRELCIKRNAGYYVTDRRSE